MKKTLIVCRVENARGAPAWLRDGEGKNYRCIASQYGVDAADEHHHYSGGKWSGIHDFFTRHPELIDEYDYFWFPDDDIETTPQDIARFFSICHAENFELAQPALTPDSVYAYRITIGNPRFQFRQTNFVELMMPLIKKNLLIRLLPYFAQRHAALGLDWMWHQLVSNPRRHVAIVDAVLMRHRRPRHHHLAGRMRQRGLDIHEERAHTLREFKIQPIEPVAHAGRLLSGRDVSSRRVSIETVVGYLSIRKEITQRRWTVKNYLKFMRGTGNKRVKA